MLLDRDARASSYPVRILGESLGESDSFCFLQRTLPIRMVYPGVLRFYNSLHPLTRGVFFIFYTRLSGRVFFETFIMN